MEFQAATYLYNRYISVVMTMHSNNAFLDSALTPVKRSAQRMFLRTCHSNRSLDWQEYMASEANAAQTPNSRIYCGVSPLVLSTSIARHFMDYARVEFVLAELKRMGCYRFCRKSLPVQVLQAFSFWTGLNGSPYICRVILLPHCNLL